MLVHVALISFIISLSTVPPVEAGIIGYSCQYNNIGGICVVLDDTRASKECDNINGFIEQMAYPDGDPNGWPGCGTANNVLHSQDSQLTYRLDVVSQNVVRVPMDGVSRSLLGVITITGLPVPHTVQDFKNVTSPKISLNLYSCSMLYRVKDALRWPCV